MFVSQTYVFLKKLLILEILLWLTGLCALSIIQKLLTENFSLPLVHSSGKPKKKRHTGALNFVLSRIFMMCYMRETVITITQLAYIAKLKCLFGVV